MRGLTAQNLLEVCEWAEAGLPATRAMALLYAACPETSWDQLAALSIGRRDALLLELREKTFGMDMQGYAECEHCGERLEFAITTDDVRVSEETLDCERTLDFKGNYVRFRVPNSVDLLAISTHSDAGLACSELLRRCLIEASRNGEPVDCEKLPEDVVSAISEKMSQCDPQAEVLLNLHCPACEQHAQFLFDISSFIWVEIIDLAKRLMDQVHLLARGYGWKEADILAMSAWRRRHYQDLLGI